MLLFHGSTDSVEFPEIRKSPVYLDFGTGFYTTTSYEQAERWAKIKMRRNNVEQGYVSVTIQLRKYFIFNSLVLQMRSGWSLFQTIEEG